MSPKQEDLINNTAKAVVEFWSRSLRPGPVDELELSSEPTILDRQMTGFKKYPKEKSVKLFEEKLKSFTLEKLTKTSFLKLQTEQFPKGDFETIIISSGLELSIFPEFRETMIWPGKIKITNFLNQEEIIEIK